MTASEDREVSTWAIGGLRLLPKEAAVHLVLRSSKALVIPLFFLTGALLITTGQTDEEGVVDIGPGASLDNGAGAILDPALYPGILAVLLGFVALVGGLGLSYVLSRRLVPGPGTGRWLSRRLTGGLGYRERWAYTKAFNGLRLLRATRNHAVEVLDRTRLGLGTTLQRVAGWSPVVVWVAVVAVIVSLWVRGQDTTFRWRWS